jgi:hypothetical protein
MTSKKTPANSQIVSKARVADHGEVYTNPSEVNAMLDLVKVETERIESRFLEPACGTGNFLVEILRRKLAVVRVQYAKQPRSFERYTVLAVTSIYGIDILADNLVACRRRLYDIVAETYKSAIKRVPSDEFMQVIMHILNRNIVHGDALTLQTVNEPIEPITFAEWSFINNTMLKRRDFIFRQLVEQDQAPNTLISDQGEIAFIPTPVAEYPAVHYMRIADV